MIERIIRAMAVLVGSAYAFGGSGVTSGERPVVLGLGAACVDYVVQVDNYPPADAKVRTECFDTMGGGNCANTLTALSRLGVRSKILTKIGNDAIGEGVIKDLELEGIDVSLLKRYEGPSASTYIIVDRTAHTRTCFHTPGKEELLPREVDPSIDLIGVDLLHLDGRMTLAAIKLAKSANTQGIPVTLDVEKDRPHLCELLPLADYIFTNSNFPATYTDAPTRAQAMEKLLHVGRAKMVVTTMGADGCLVMCKRSEMGPYFVTDDLKKMEYSSGSIDLYHFGSNFLHPEDIVDTTGAGDGFIGATIYGILANLPLGKTIALASYVAAEKIKKKGARSGLPSLDDVRSALAL